MKRATIYISISLALSLGLLLVLLWLLGGEIGISMAAIRAAEPAGLNAPGDVYCVTLEGGGPYPGCNQIFTSVQDAVDAASGGEVIKVAAGDYTGVQGRPAPAGYEGPSAITQVVYISKTVAVWGGYTTTNWAMSYPITQPTTLDAQGQGRVLFIAGDISPTIAGLRITGGDATGLGGWGDVGGGIYAVGAAADIRENWVFSNTADSGGGLYLHESVARLNGNTVFANTAEDGGGLYLRESPATLSGNTIISNTAYSIFGSYGCGGLTLWNSGAAILSDNTVTANTGGVGGGIRLSGMFGASTPTVNWNIITFNTAHIRGGGVYLECSDGTLSGNTIISNTAYEGGGGLAVWGGAPILNGNIVVSNTAAAGGGLYLDGSDAMLSGNTIVANTANGTDSYNWAGGGGMHLAWSNVTLTNNIIADNQTSSAGGALFIRDYSVYLLHNTIARNHGGDGSGIYVAASYGTVALTNTILVSHTVGVSITVGHTATLEATLWGDGDWANDTDWGGAGTIITGAVNHWGDPGFLNPENGDYHIGSGSAALDRGVVAGVTVDIDREPRPYENPDIGADEYWPPGALKHIYLPLVLRVYP